MNYYEQLLKNYSQNNNFQNIQKTPQQIAQEQKEGTYQVFMNTKEGIDAIADLRGKFEVWYSANYESKQPVISDDVREMKDLFAKMSEQNAAMAKQIDILSNQLK